MNRKCFFFSRFETVFPRANSCLRLSYFQKICLVRCMFNILYLIRCLDCSRNCTIGTLNAACDACTCIHHELSGRVLTEDDIPLSDANISLAETPYKIIAQTNISGYFATLGVCAIQQELLITKAGFVPVKLMANVTTPTTVNISAKMEIAGMRYFVSS